MIFQLKQIKNMEKKEEAVRKLAHSIYTWKIKLCRCLYGANINFFEDFLYNNFEKLKVVNGDRDPILYIDFDISILRNRGYKFVVYTSEGKVYPTTADLQKIVEKYTIKESQNCIRPVWAGNIAELGGKIDELVNYFVKVKNIPVITMEIV